MIGGDSHDKPRAIRLDNGPEMTSQGFTDWAQRHGVRMLFIQPGNPNQNAFIERFSRSFRVEVLDANLFNSISEVQMAADDWLIDYNEYRPHESLGDVPPATFKFRSFNWMSLVSNCPLDGEAYDVDRDTPKYQVFRPFLNTTATRP